MALPESAFQNPYWIIYNEGATLSRDDRARFDCQEYGGANTRHWRIEPQRGYNPNDQSAVPERVRLDNDSLTMRPR